MSDDPHNRSDPHEPTIEWVTPWTYPTRLSYELTLAIVEDVARGASLRVAAMARGISPRRLALWLSWGAEAYEQGGDGNDSHAVYIDLYVKAMQATGLAGVINQQRVRALSPAWWLAHHPELRGEWGGDDEQELLERVAPEPEPGSVVEALPPPLPKLSHDDLRVVLRTLIESGAAQQPAAASENPEARRDEGQGVG